MTRTARLRVAFVALGAAALPAACSHANYAPLVATTATPSANPSASASAGATASASPSPSVSATLAPAACGTAAPNAAYIAMGSYIEPHVDPTYGTVYGYVEADAQGNYPLSAAPISLSPGQLVQFVNVDPVDASGSGASHSAVGLQASFFPANVTFPVSAQGPIGTTFSATALWSTGLIAAGASTVCYSQTFTTPSSGTYYFGDDQFYSSVNERDVIVVGPPGSTVTQRMPVRDP